MGMFDDVTVYQVCPHCKQWGRLALQTKDLECALYHYIPLDADWFTNESPFGRKMRQELPMFPSVPLDKSYTVWASQAEHTEAQATPSKEYRDQLKYIRAYGDCPQCGAWLDGKIRLEEARLIGGLYDVTIEIAKGGIVFTVVP